MSALEMVNELRRMAAAHEIDNGTALRLLLAAQAELMETQAAHKHDTQYAPCEHEHDDLYAGKLHEHPFSYLAAGLSALAAAAVGILIK
jgi:hypothetical protein